MAHYDIKRYLWLIGYLHDTGGASYKVLDDAFQDPPIIQPDLNPTGKPYANRTFHNDMKAIWELFGIKIDLDRQDGKYKIFPAKGDAQHRQQDFISMLLLNKEVDRDSGFGKRVIYDEPMMMFPEFIPRIIKCMKSDRKVILSYQKFSDDAPKKRLISPYCLKLFKRRWYLLGEEKGRLRTFALDTRTRGVIETEEIFTLPVDFNPEEFFADIYGIRKTASSKTASVKVKTYGDETFYWRSSPLHHSQREIATADTYSIFSLDVAVDSWEFIQELLSRGNRIEVLKPASLRRAIYEQVELMRSRYATTWQNPFGSSEKNSDISSSENPKVMHNVTIPIWDTQAAANKAAKGSYGQKAVRADVYKSNNEIFAAGCYKTDNATVVQLPGADDPMLEGTTVYSEQFRLGKGPIAAAGTETRVVNEDCLKLAKKMIDEGLNPAVLNLADCYTACGWYPRGSSAQEESISRVTTLSRSLYQYYTENQAQAVNVPFKGRRYPMDYHFGGIYSPGVTVFRDGADNFRLKENLYKVSIISVAALNFRDREDHPARDCQYRAADGGFTPEGLTIMKDKIRTIYRIALVNGHDSIVLGAFGCGAFRLRSDLVAKLFHDILEEDEFFGRFKDVRFAILEHGKASETGINGRFAPFYQLFSM